MNPIREQGDHNYLGRLRERLRRLGPAGIDDAIRVLRLGGAESGELAKFGVRNEIELAAAVASCLSVDPDVSPEYLEPFLTTTLPFCEASTEFTAVISGRSKPYSVIFEVPLASLVPTDGHTQAGAMQVEWGNIAFRLASGSTLNLAIAEPITRDQRWVTLTGELTVAAWPQLMRRIGIAGDVVAGFLLAQEVGRPPHLDLSGLVRAMGSPGQRPKSMYKLPPGAPEWIRPPFDAVHEIHLRDLVIHDWNRLVHTERSDREVALSEHQERCCRLLSRCAAEYDANVFSVWASTLLEVVSRRHVEGKGISKTERIRQYLESTHPESCDDLMAVWDRRGRFVHEFEGQLSPAAQLISLSVLSQLVRGELNSEESE